MANYVGLRDFSDLREYFIASNFTSLGEIDFSQLYNVIKNELAAVNKQQKESLSTFCNPTIKSSMSFRVGSRMAMEEGDEYSIPSGTKDTGHWEVSFPLDYRFIGLGWLRSWWDRHDPDDLRADLDGLYKADGESLMRLLKQALYCLSLNRHQS